MEKRTDGQSVDVFTQFFKDMVIISIGTVLSLFIVDLFGLALLRTRVSTIPEGGFLLRLLSLQIIPSAVAYALLIAASCYLFRKSKRAMIRLAESEILAQREQAVIQTSQRITSMMAGYITQHNGRIQEWVEERRANGHQPPKRVDDASRKIGLALRALTEVSYILPYTGSGSRDVDYYVDHLEHNLKMITQRALPVPANKRSYD
jgi:hypothetical protein